MKNVLIPVYLFVLFSVISICSVAQTQCNITQIRTGTTQKLVYTVSKNSPATGKFHSGYMVTDKNGTPYKIFKVSNNTTEREISIEMMDGKTGQKDEDYTFSYSPFAGLVLNPDGDSITALRKPYEYLYLISFEDEKKQFVNLHFLTKIADYSVLFSTVSDSLMRQNKAMLQQIALYKVMLEQQQAEQKISEQKRLEQEAQQRHLDSLIAVRVNQELAAEREKLQLQKQMLDSIEKEKTIIKPFSNDNIIVGIDSLCKQFVADSMRVEKILEEINEEIRRHPSEESEVDGDNRYAGDKKNGSWQGNGLMIVANRKIYKGIFENSQFISGVVFLRYEKGDQYCGEYSHAMPRGFGKYRSANGDLSLGYFNSGGFERGIVSKTYGDGSYYYGHATADKKDGYGVFIGPTGSKYIGLFQSDKLQAGYASQTDDVGAKSFFEYADFVKKPIDPEIWRKFVEEYNKLILVYNPGNNTPQNKTEARVISPEEQQRKTDWLRRNGPVWGHLVRHNSGPDIGVQIHKIEKEAKSLGITTEELEKFRDKNYIF